ncbi:MAG: arginine--tRNA ligase [Phycisphaeraceae bacterium]|nr:arginine--tRNA ligase [Phycisphaeraceae bacterium]
MSIDPVQILAERFRAAIAAAFPDSGADADPLITPSRNPQHGDFQSNTAMPLGKSLGKPPREIAKSIAAKVDLAGIAEPLTDASIAGPGFINIRLSTEALASLVTRLDSDDLGLPRVEAGGKQTVVVDLCGVNLAKQMHVGHLRSIIIGDAIARTLDRVGHRVIRQNHVGDWGLPIAMVTARLMQESKAGRLDLARLTLDQLERHYRAAQRECAADERGLAAARRWWSHPKAVAELEEQVAGAAEELARAKATLVRLQNHDPETFGVWQRIADTTMGECLDVCRRLHADVTAEASAGESSYSEELAGLVEDLQKRGVSEESDGALVVRVEGIEEPTLIRKSERGGGGYLYATTDMAAIRRRVQRLGADRVIYCVDARQSLHFRQVFAAAIKAGYATRPGQPSPSRLEHAAFGAVLGEDGRPFKTRSGENVKLADLIDEAVGRARRAAVDKNAELKGSELEAIADAIGVGAIKYADLSSDRVRDYVFDFDRMIAFEGNTGPYLLYALVRIRSILRKAAEHAQIGEAGLRRAESAPLLIEAREEKDLALALLRYPGAVRSVADALEPHRLCQYLYDLAGAYSVFFTNCHVLSAETDALRLSRLRLCRITERVLAEGLSLLGITALDRM